MKKGDYAELKMKKALCQAIEFDNRVHECALQKYDEQKECLYLVLENSELPEISLDAVYECKIYAEGSISSCTGRVKERYCGEEGKILQFEIENGFYKITIKSVDKQIV